MSNQMVPDHFFIGLPAVDQCFDFVSGNDILSTALVGTAVSSGTITHVAGVANGVVRLSGVATTANTGYELQETKATIDLEANAVHSFACRFKVSSDTDPILLAGFAVADTSLIASAPSDGIYLSKATAVDDVYIVVRTGSSTIYNRLVDADLDTSYHVWGIQVECHATPSNALITVYKDGKIVDQFEAVGIPDTALMAMSLAMQAGNTTGTQTLDLDYIRRRSWRVNN